MKDPIQINEILYLSLMMVLNVIFYVINIIVTSENIRRVKRMEEEQKRTLEPVVTELKNLINSIKQEQ